MSHCLYLYGVTDQHVEHPPAGWASQPLTPVPTEAGVAWVCSVPVAMWQQAADELRDVKSLAPFVRHHMDTLKGLSAERSLVPAPFGALFSSRGALTESLCAKAPTIHSLLEHVAGASEFSLKGIVQAAKTARPERAEGWLLQRSSQARRSRDRKRLLKGAAEALGQALEPLCRDTTSRPTLGLEDGEMWFNWALLVAHGDEQAVLTAIAEVQDQVRDLGMQLEVGGPFPAFSFCADMELGNG